MGKAPDFVSVIDLSMPHRDLVLSIMRDVANQELIDFSNWNNQRKSCEIQGVQVGYEVVGRQTMLVMYHPDYGTRHYNPDSVDLEHVMYMILCWMRRDHKSVVYGPPVRAGSGWEGAKAQIQLRSIRGH